MRMNGGTGGRGGKRVTPSTAGSAGSSAILRAAVLLTAAVIIIPVLLTAVWSVTGRWPWPGLTPETYTLRAVRELFFGANPIGELLASSMAIGASVAAAGTVIALMAARATEIYRVKVRGLVEFGSMLPLLVPGTVFAMGIQVTLIRMGLAGSAAGVILVHLVAALPYCMTIMLDMTAAVGASLEEQAAVLGAAPLRAFAEVSLPQLMPGVLSSMSMAFIISYSQYFTTLLAGGGRVRTFAMVLVPYIQSGDRALSAAYSVVFVGSALVVFAIFKQLGRIRRD